MDGKRIEIRQRLDETIELFGFWGRVLSCSPSGAVIDFSSQGFIVLLAGCDGPTACSLSFILPGYTLGNVELEEAKARLFTFFEIPAEATVDVRVAGPANSMPPVVAPFESTGPKPLKAILVGGFEWTVRLVKRDYRWDRPPADDIYSVPRQFDMATVFTMFVAFSLLFSLMLALDATPGLILAFASFFVVVGAAQAVLFEGGKPREASVLSGAAWGTILITLGAMASGVLLMSFAIVLLAPFYCAFLGYLAGTVNGGIWLVTDYLRQWMIKRRMMKGVTVTEASSPFDDVSEQHGQDNGMRASNVVAASTSSRTASQSEVDLEVD
ncbi:MAG: hypothetical protein AB8B50_10515 [Pirellulaceae bacterium]